jgi:type II secretory pathway component PulC
VNIRLPLPIDTAKIPKVVAGALVCAIAVQSLVTFRSASSYSLATSQPTVAALTAQSVPRASAPDVAAIAAANLFGVSAPAVQDMQSSQAGLVLVGVLAMDDPAAGLAILGTDPASATTHSVGALVDDSARLWQVHARYVVLERNGRFEQLELSRPDSFSTASSLFVPPEEQVATPRKVAAVIPEGDDPPALPIMVDNADGLPQVANSQAAPPVHFAAVAPGDDPPAVPIRIDNPSGLNL